MSNVSHLLGALVCLTTIALFLCGLSGCAAESATWRGVDSGYESQTGPNAPPEELVALD